MVVCAYVSFAIDASIVEPFAAFRLSTRIVGSKKYNAFELNFIPLALIQRGLFITAAHALTSLLRRLKRINHHCHAGA